MLITNQNLSEEPGTEVFKHKLNLCPLQTLKSYFYKRWQHPAEKVLFDSNMFPVLIFKIKIFAALLFILM